MYTSFYNLTGRPFQLTPDPRFYFDSKAHKKAMAYLTYGLSQREGFIIITGDIGAGKTTLVGHLLDTLDTKQYVAAKVVTTQLQADDVLRMVAAAFGIKHEGADKATLLKKIEDFLLGCMGQGKRVLLIVDEAQNLPNGALEELRMLSNFQVDENALLQCFLLGQPQFRDRLARDPDLEQVRQRVIATYFLGPLADAGETANYIKHRLQRVGWNDDPTFAEETFEKIYSYTGGVPRMLNTLCSRLLLFGYLEESHEISGKTVDDVIADLERDNEPVTRPSRSPVVKAAPSSGTVERYEHIAERVEVLEKYVKAHERTISRALEIAETWLSGGEQGKAE
jgi:putative secretion ATPase (PEP-CTERM system associated)